MRKASDILKEMAFNKDAPESTKEALLKNMRKALTENSKAEVVPIESKNTKDEPKQMSFDFDQYWNQNNLKVRAKK